MNVYRIDRETLDAALADVNRIYNDNIEWFTDPTPKGTGYTFRIKARDRRGPGSALSASYWRLKDGSRRRTGSACWHAHGHLFDAIVHRSPESHIRALGRKIDVNGGNWHDWGAGPMIEPVYMSELCECRENRYPLNADTNSRGGSQ